MSFPCILCNIEVSDADIAIHYDVCHRWNHLACGTGVSLSSYRNMMNLDEVINWKYPECEDNVVLGDISQAGDISEIEATLLIQEEIRIDEFKIISGGNLKGGDSENYIFYELNIILFNHYKCNVLLLLYG